MSSLTTKKNKSPISLALYLLEVSKTVIKNLDIRFHGN